VLGTRLQRLPGGKGANQAVAAAAAGAQVVLVGCVGDDADGRSYRAGLERRGVGVDALRVVDAPTGTALIVVDESGENSIVVVPGANATVTQDDVRRLDLHADDVLLVQLEIPLDVVAAAIRHAQAVGARVVLNVAPYADLDADLLAAADPVVANETEAAALATMPRSLVVTLGSRGARWTADGATREVAAPVVEAVDTTGAGDAFAGTLAARLAAGADDEVALADAVAAAAESVTTVGAQGGWTL
jgi:ribokinase